MNETHHHPGHPSAGAARDALLEELEAIRGLLGEAEGDRGAPRQDRSPVPVAGAPTGGIPVLDRVVDGSSPRRDDRPASRDTLGATGGRQRLAAPGAAAAGERSGLPAISHPELFDEEWRRRTQALLDAARARVKPAARDAWAERVQARVTRELSAAVHGWVDQLVEREAAVIRQDLLRRFRNVLAAETGAGSNPD